MKLLTQEQAEFLKDKIVESDGYPTSVIRIIDTNTENPKRPQWSHCSTLKDLYDLKTFLGIGFIWSKTPQGNQYWLNIYKTVDSWISELKASE